MEWYWYVLIGVGVVGLGVLKVVVGKKWLSSRKKEEQKSYKDKED